MNKRGHVLNAALLSVGLGFLVEPAGSVETYVTVLEVGVPVVLGALFPDVDTAFGRHRKTLHNLPVLVGFLAFPVVFGNLEFVWIGIFTHYVLDAAGSKRGIALFYPLWDREFGLPMGVSVGTRGAGVVTVVVTALELAVAAVVLHWPPERAIELGEAAIRAAVWTAVG
ncbi:metal-dependent hydrolase [Saliphagus sp. LR7]|uniref:metal-dependent hydrolase n=1 Tax=Saliphagus sp. LR7 TaxID=2282654 RepID=UPI000DF79483|nr:metal-dependent hydrolase [Saliphagus sp. LR7]